MNKLVKIQVLKSNYGDDFILMRVEDALRIFKSGTKLANYVGITKQAVSKWKYNRISVPQKYIGKVLDFAKFNGYRIKEVKAMH